MRLARHGDRICILHEYNFDKLDAVSTVEYEDGSIALVPFTELRMTDTKRLMNDIAEDISCDHDCGCNHICNKCEFSPKNRGV